MGRPSRVEDVRVVPVGDPGAGEQRDRVEGEEDAAQHLDDRFSFFVPSCRILIVCFLTPFWPSIVLFVRPLYGPSQSACAVGAAQSLRPVAERGDLIACRNTGHNNL